MQQASVYQRARARARARAYERTMHNTRTGNALVSPCTCMHVHTCASCVQVMIRTPIRLTTAVPSSSSNSRLVAGCPREHPTDLHTQLAACFAPADQGHRHTQLSFAALPARARACLLALRKTLRHMYIHECQSWRITHAYGTRSSTCMYTCAQDRHRHMYRHRHRHMYRHRHRHRHRHCAHMCTGTGTCTGTGRARVQAHP